MIKFLILLIIVLILLNLYICSSLLNGNWESTEEFSEKSDSKLYLNLQGHFYRNAKLIIIKDEALVFEGNIIFLGSPHGLLFWRNFGLAIISFDSPQNNEKIMPKLLYYTFSPLSGKLCLFKEKIYGEFQKL